MLPAQRRWLSAVSGGPAFRVAGEGGVVTSVPDPETKLSQWQGRENQRGRRDAGLGGQGVGWLTPGGRGLLRGQSPQGQRRDRQDPEAAFSQLPRLLPGPERLGTGRARPLTSHKGAEVGRGLLCARRCHLDYFELA